VGRKAVLLSSIALYQEKKAKKMTRRILIGGNDTLERFQTLRAKISAYQSRKIVFYFRPSMHNVF
jgi:hypothetical protein